MSDQDPVVEAIYRSMQRHNWVLDKIDGELKLYQQRLAEYEVVMDPIMAALYRRGVILLESIRDRGMGHDEFTAFVNDRRAA